MSFNYTLSATETAAALSCSGNLGEAKAARFLMASLGIDRDAAEAKLSTIAPSSSTEEDGFAFHYWSVETLAAAIAPAAETTDAPAAETTDATAPQATAEPLETLVSRMSTSQTRFQVWRGGRETRVYVKSWNGSRNRPWIDAGYYIVSDHGFECRSKRDLDGIDEFEAALTAFLGN